MSFSFLYKWALVLGLLLGHVVTVFAQDANMDRAKHVYELFVLCFPQKPVVIRLLQ